MHVFFGFKVLAPVEIAFVMLFGQAEQKFFADGWVDRSSDVIAAPKGLKFYVNGDCSLIVEEQRSGSVFGTEGIIFRAKRKLVWIGRKENTVIYSTLERDKLIGAFDSDFKECAEKAKKLPESVRAKFLGFHGII